MTSEKVELELWNLEIPLNPPIHSPKEAVTRTFVLLAFLKDADGRRGVGYSSFRKQPDLDRATGMARNLAAQAGLNLPGMLGVERIEAASASENPANSKAAANVLSLAAWDLAGQRANCACADLWGRPPNRDSLECYASAFWLDKSLDQLIDEGREHQKNNYRLVKMRVNRSVKESLERIAAVQTVYSEPRTIALETGFDWDVAIANEFYREAPGEYLWIEDPASYDTIGQIQRNDRNTIAAGEKCTSAAELVDLYVNGGIRNLIIDVQYVGGPVRFLEAARLLNALGATIGGHRFSHYSMHLLASLPRSLPIEMLDWTNPSVRPIPAPDASGRLPVRGPGFGLTLNQSIIDQHGVKV